jgi:tetratricopeptide (TPR) repeat protein
MKLSIITYIGLHLLLLTTSCSKEAEFLDAKPSISLVVPTTLDDYQKLLYNEGVFNSTGAPFMGLVTTDEYYVTPAYWASCPINERNVYTYKNGDIWESAFTFTDWNNPYNQVRYANTVLDGIAKINPGATQQLQYNQIKGQALFFRSFAFYNLIQTFAMPFDSTTYSTNLGIPLRLSSDFNVSVQRSTIKECYDQILSDLNDALSLLPAVSDYPTQPNKTAGNALMARIYLAIRNYPKALQYSSAALNLNNTLVDYNTLTPATTYLSTTYMKEDLYQSSMSNAVVTSFSGSTMVDSVLYSFYDDVNDLRKTVFFRIILTG